MCVAAGEVQEVIGEVFVLLIDAGMPVDRVGERFFRQSDARVIVQEADLLVAHLQRLFGLRKPPGQQVEFALGDRAKDNDQVPVVASVVVDLGDIVEHHLRTRYVLLVQSRKHDARLGEPQKAQSAHICQTRPRVDEDVIKCLFAARDLHCVHRFAQHCGKHVAPGTQALRVYRRLKLFYQLAHGLTGFFLQLVPVRLCQRKLRDILRVVLSHASRREHVQRTITRNAGVELGRKTAGEVTLGKPSGQAHLVKRTADARDVASANHRQVMNVLRLLESDPEVNEKVVRDIGESLLRLPLLLVQHADAQARRLQVHVHHHHVPPDRREASRHVEQRLRPPDTSLERVKRGDDGRRSFVFPSSKR